MNDLERLARALCIADGLNPDSDCRFCEESGVMHDVALEDSALWITYLPKVRAILQELRVPSKEMEEAGI